MQRTNCANSKVATHIRADKVACQGNARVIARPTILDSPGLRAFPSLGHSLHA